MIKTDSLIKVAITLLTCIAGFGVSNQHHYVDVDYSEYVDKVVVKNNGKEEEIETLSVDRISSVNQDIVGVVLIDGVLEEPFVQGKDNDEYLRRNLAYEKVSAGVNFMDYRSSLDSQNIIIYGHSSKYQKDILFTSLLKYESEDFYRQHPTIKLVANNLMTTYEIVSVFYFDVTGSNAATFTKQHWAKESMMLGDLNALKDLSLYQTKDITKCSQMLTLVTCNVRNDNERMIIVAIKN